jgi:hypothetical protein
VQISELYLPAVDPTIKYARPISLAVVHQSQNNLRSAGVNSQTVFSGLSQSHYLSPYDGRWMGSTRRFLQKLEIRKAYRKLAITTQVGGWDPRARYSIFGTPMESRKWNSATTEAKTARTAPPSRGCSGQASGAHFSFRAH